MCFVRGNNREGVVSSEKSNYSPSPALPVGKSRRVVGPSWCLGHCEVSFALVLPHNHLLSHFPINIDRPTMSKTKSLEFSRSAKFSHDHRLVAFRVAKEFMSDYYLKKDGKFTEPGLLGGTVLSTDGDTLRDAANNKPGVRDKVTALMTLSLLRASMIDPWGCAPFRKFTSSKELAVAGAPSVYDQFTALDKNCLLYTSPSPRD